MARKFFAVVILPLSLGACGLERLQSCQAGHETTTDRLIVAVADRLAAQSHAAGEANLIPYSDGRKLMSLNPNCCSVFSGTKLISGTVKLPMLEQVTVSVTYRKFNSGEKQYFSVNSDTMPCPENFEDGGRTMSNTEYAHYSRNSHAK